MPIDYQQVYTKIKEIGASVTERKKKKEEAQALARELLAYYDSLLDELRAKVDSARQIDSNTRCAYPLAETLASSIPPIDSPAQVTLIAADGSQINPDRHATQQYFVINVGSIVMQVGSGNVPEVFTDTELHLLDEFDDNFFSESQVALQRDIAERKKLLEIAQKYSGTVIALTEGQLELWGATDPDNGRDFQKSLLDYLESLKELEKRKVITSGYVDKPGANWVIRLLEIASAPADLKELKKYHPLLGATDLWLFSQILGKHQRSAIFALKAKSAEKYADSLAIHFFYLNVGDEKKPKIARVDVPLWVVNDAQALNDLHAALIAQSKIMGEVAPFPYLLHRAHEIAVVSHREKEQIDQMLDLAIRNSGGDIGEISGKQSAKNLQGRTRK
jgi:hypothetical protein